MATRKRKTKGEKEIQGVIKKELEPIQKELTLAYKRINGNSIRRLRWLLEFAEIKLDAISQGKLVDVGWEVAMFGANVKPEKLHEDITYFGIRLMMIDHSNPERPVYGTQVNAALIREFQNKMKTVFDLLYAGEWWDYTYPRKVKRIATPHLAPKGQMKADNWEALNPDEQLELRAFELLEAEKGRLMVCANPNCKRRFVATKQGRTRFHSPTCSAYVRIAKSRGKRIGPMTVEEAKALIFDTLCSQYHKDNSKNKYIDGNTVRIDEEIPEDIFQSALEAFVHAHSQLYVEVDQRGWLRFGLSGLDHCRTKRNPFKGA